ncbi:MAG: hypothetical protein JOZ73_04530 [Solirubrobacterales bacterium]|nr:hypothetical protein [Solirubrobacterales bacterium]
MNSRVTTDHKADAVGGWGWHSHYDTHTVVEAGLTAQPQTPKRVLPLPVAGARLE